MLQFPPIPTWDSLHVLVIHFPIALLLLSPVFIVISAVLSPLKGRPYMSAALITLLLGTASVFIAASTGHSAAELAERGGPADAVLKTHQELAEETEIVFAGLSAILLAMVAVPRLLARGDNRLFSTFLPSAFLALYTVGVLFLINTAHEGGRLVHEFGVHAILPPDQGANQTSHTSVTEPSEEGAEMR
ncbi:DUF2231 domain-containing protein [Occallatibacter savannae]|uniref:DUF2231 domain-containing protein n=1 Tax=Occallatibacter savannae TaxID=1002691 RepID=UPI000D68F961|nr:DUF2231 domain-containing protein [Occallatibacter savannae]